MGKPIREFESRPLRKQKGDTKSVALIVCRKPSSACGRKADGEQLGGLAEQRPFCLQGRPRQRRDMQSRPLRRSPKGNQNQQFTQVGC